MMQRIRCTREELKEIYPDKNEKPSFSDFFSCTTMPDCKCQYHIWVRKKLKELDEDRI